MTRTAAKSRAQRRRGIGRAPAVLDEDALLSSMSRSADAMADAAQGFPIDELDYSTVSAALIGLAMNAEPPPPDTQIVPSAAVKYMATNIMLGFVMGWRAAVDARDARDG